ncbi:MAG: hypothetical protein EBV57_03830 [Betaproteobacteria bacterium]|nr:hypothetical protein [Betaproteobacteria bacterium]
MPPIAAQTDTLATPRAWITWPLLAALAAAMLFIGRGVNVFIDPDSYWHLAAGRWIIEHRTIPTTDPFSWTFAGSPWLAHEWLSEVLIAAAFQAGEWLGVAALMATAFALSMAAMTRALMRRAVPRRALMLLPLVLLTFNPHLLARPHVLALLPMCLWVVHLMDRAEAGRSPSVWALPLIAVWSCLHGSFLLGLLLVPVFAFETILASPTARIRWTQLRGWTVFLLGSVAVCCATPLGPEALLFPFQVVGMNKSLALIGEWQSPNFQTFQAVEVWILLSLAIALLLKPEMRWTRVLLLLGVLHLALKHQRHADLLALLGPLVLIGPLNQALERCFPANHATVLDRIFLRMADPGRASVFVMAVGLAIAGMIAIKQTDLKPAAGNSPEAALAAVAQAGIEGPVFNHYNFGGYLIFRGIPTFIDGRADLFGDDFVSEVTDASKLGEKLVTLIERYQPGWTLLPPNSPAIWVLDNLPGWQRFYADDVAVVHRRIAADAPTGNAQPR